MVPVPVSVPGKRFRRFRFHPCPSFPWCFFFRKDQGKEGPGLSVSGKTVPAVPVPGSGSVPEPPCLLNLWPQVCVAQERKSSPESEFWGRISRGRPPLSFLSFCFGGGKGSSLLFFFVSLRGFPCFF